MMCLTDWQVEKQGNPSRVEIHRKRNPATGHSVEKGYRDKNELLRRVQGSEGRAAVVEPTR